MKRSIIIILVIFILGLLSGCVESEYERAGKEFGSWINKNPNTWSKSQKDYFNNFMDWADNN